MMGRTVLAGFVPLVDSAVLVAAKEFGFGQAHDLDLQLVKQPSWASLRDHLNLGHFDCAHALAPLPIASAFGIGQVEANTGVPFVLGRGGNAITVSGALADALRRSCETIPSNSQEWGRALASIVAQRKKQLTLAMVYPFSGHNFELRYWLASAGIHPDRDVRIVAIPPPLMVESLRAGHVDGFCVGEPWNSLAVTQGVGEIIVSKSEIFPRGIEKVLALPATTLRDESLVSHLLLSLYAAAIWCDDPLHHAALADVLARDTYLDIEPELAMCGLSGRLPTSDGSVAHDPDFLYFSRHNANRPNRADALWIYAQMCRWGQLPASRDAEDIAARVFRPDIFDTMLGSDATQKSPPITACDGYVFDASRVDSYVASCELQTRFVAAGADIHG